MSLISLQGKIWMAERSAQGKALKQTWVGQCPDL
ncbi:bacteriophage protein [Pseudomonas aeruginosa]|nr:bacteriophage protein [Pseudomonas aeruginosa]